LGSFAAPTLCVEILHSCEVSLECGILAAEERFDAGNLR
jgi:hypothetical protein